MLLTARLGPGVAIGWSRERVAIVDGIVENKRVSFAMSSRAESCVRVQASSSKQGRFVAPSFLPSNVATRMS